MRAREARKALHPDLEGLFGTLKRGDSSASKTGSLRTSASVSSAVSDLPSPPKVPKKLSSLSSMSSSSASPVPTAVVHPVASKPGQKQIGVGGSSNKTRPVEGGKYPLVCKIPKKDVKLMDKVCVFV